MSGVACITSASRDEPSSSSNACAVQKEGGAEDEEDEEAAERERKRAEEAAAKRALRVVLLSSRAETRLLTEKYDAALTDCDAALALQPDHARSLSRRERAQRASRLRILLPLCRCYLRTLLLRVAICCSTS